jgi:hypothetical protein
VLVNMLTDLLFINNIEDTSTMSLPILLIHEKGTTDKFRGINELQASEVKSPHHPPSHDET